MKYACIIALFLFSITAVPEVAVAQKLTKKERKRLKKEKKKRLKELKKMSEADFQKQQDQTKELTAKASELEGELSSVKSQLDKKDSEVKQLKDQVRRLQDDLQQAKAEANTAQENIPMASNDAEYNQGLVFRVQIGAYQNQDLSNYDTSENFTAENGDDGKQKYTLGNFRDYWEADKFKKYLRVMGVKDAWIVPYRDGGRVPIKDVLEDLRSNPSSAASVN